MTTSRAIRGPTSAGARRLTKGPHLLGPRSCSAGRPTLVPATPSPPLPTTVAMPHPERPALSRDPCPWQTTPGRHPCAHARMDTGHLGLLALRHRLRSHASRRRGPPRGRLKVDSGNSPRILWLVSTLRRCLGWVNRSPSPPSGSDSDGQGRAPSGRLGRGQRFQIRPVLVAAAVLAVTSTQKPRRARWSATARPSSAGVCQTREPYCVSS